MERGAIGLQHVEDQRADLLVDGEEKLVRNPGFRDGALVLGDDVGRSLCPEPSKLEMQGTLAECLDECCVVRNKEQCDTAFCQSLEALDAFQLESDVADGKSFVDDQDVERSASAQNS